MDSARERVGRNVVSPAGDVEASAPRAARRTYFMGAWALLFLLLILGAPACVDTAECNATVSCPGGEVCFEYECRPRCESAAQCPADQVCSPCQTISGTHDQGKCFGADLSACVDENS
ncbi:hypothetical protein DFR33_106262 [Bradymonas sediminis]|nr:hypothetical protein DFR33_106262 [Bradymonas sediminis]